MEAENHKFRQSVKEKVLDKFKVKEEPEKKTHLHPQQYESGLEVVRPLPRNPNDVPPLEVSPYPHLDAKTLSTPQVANDPTSWHHHHLKKNPGLEVVSPPSVMSSSRHSSTLCGESQDGMQHPSGYNRPTASDSKSVDGFGMGPTVCGMRRKVFYIVMAVVIISVVAAIAIGLGTGLAFSRRLPGDDKLSSIPSGVESTKTANISCPTSDNATFSAQAEPDRLFRLICGYDYSSEDGSIDLTSENATTMADCIDRCANRTECVGAGWGIYYDNRVCWMKSRLAKPNISGNWLFAIDLNSTDVSMLP